MNDPDLFYWNLIIWLSGCCAGFTVSALLTFVGLKLGWIRIIDSSRVAAPIARACSKRPTRTALGGMVLQDPGFGDERNSVAQSRR